MAKKQSKKKPDADQPSFEEALADLEGIVQDLEEGDLGLNEALLQYERGVKLLRQSYDLLQKAERRIELLSGIDADGNPITQPLDDQATFAPDATARGNATKTSPTEGSPEDEKRKPSGKDRGMDTPGGLF